MNLNLELNAIAQKLDAVLGNSRGTDAVRGLSRKPLSAMRALGRIADEPVANRPAPSQAPIGQAAHVHGDRYGHLREFERLMLADPRRGGAYYMANADIILAELRAAEKDKKDGKPDEDQPEKDRGVCNKCGGKKQVTCDACEGTGLAKPTKDSEDDSKALATFQRWEALTLDPNKTREAGTFYHRHTQAILDGRAIALRRGLA